MEGILLIDKPQGPTSFDVVRTIRKMTGVKKIGHAGTLDPLASGLLVICLGRYTKFASILTEHDKIYQTVVKLGQTTTTDDGEGCVTKEQSVKHVSKDDVMVALKKFRGKIKQIPPKFSAIKIAGLRAYQLARAKKSVEMPSREIEIFDLYLNNFLLPELSLTIHCSKGTYVRSLARDLGEVLKTGAHAKEIRRLKSGSYSLSDALSFTDLNPESIALHIRTGIDAIIGIDKVAIDSTERRNTIYGRPLSVNYKFSGNLAVSYFDNEPVAIIKREGQHVKLMRVI